MHEITNRELSMKISAKTRFILYNLLAAIVIFIVTGAVVLSRLDNYTRHGHFIPVPSFFGQRPDMAEILAGENNLRVLVIDSLFNENAEPGTVLEQYPAAGSPVKDNRLIHLTVNARNPEKVAVPNLQNAAYRQTLQTLESRGFKIGQIELAPSEFKNLVLDLKYRGQRITPGTLLPKGTAIDVVLGRGYGDNFVTVPQLAGKNIRDAISIARSAYLNVYKVLPDATINGQPNPDIAMVYEQIPAANEIVPAGTPVYIRVTLKKEKIVALDSLIAE